MPIKKSAQPTHILTDMGLILKQFKHHLKMTYVIEVPAAPENQEYTTNLDRATDLCYDLSVEFGYACVRNDITGEIEVDYGDIMELVENHIV